MRLWQRSGRSGAHSPKCILHIGDWAIVPLRSIVQLAFMPIELFIGTQLDRCHNVSSAVAAAPTPSQKETQKRNVGVQALGAGPGHGQSGGSCK